MRPALRRRTLPLVLGAASSSALLAPVLRPAPPPDFRCVGLELGGRRPLGAWIGLLGAGALAGTVVRGPVGAVLGLGLAGATGVLARAAGWRAFEASNETRR